ncbi:hypothetical protein IG631_16804 [Alternaria alternata]|nr:hypothetical protein IG631_16804 [Alternaria alternata]
MPQSFFFPPFYVPTSTFRFDRGVCEPLSSTKGRVGNKLRVDSLITPRQLLELLSDAPTRFRELNLPTSKRRYRVPFSNRSFDLKTTHTGATGALCC